MRLSSFIMDLRVLLAMSTKAESNGVPQTSYQPDVVSAEKAIRENIDAASELELGGVPLERKSGIIREVTTMVSMSGPLPPPAIARQYEELCPGFVDRSLRMAEKAQDASIADAQDRRDKNQFYRLFGMVCAGILSLSLIIAGSFIVVNGHIVAGTITVLVSFIASVVVAFIKGRPLSDQLPADLHAKIKTDSGAGRKQPPTKKRRR